MTLHLLRLRLAQSRPVRRWLSIRARAAKWLFGTPTTVLEVLNAGMLLVWALAVLDDRLIALPLYSTAFRLYVSSWANEAVSATPGAGGAAVVGNSYITWVNTGTRYGDIT